MDNREIEQTTGTKPSEFRDAKSEKLSEDLWDKRKKKASSNGQIMLFDDLRQALGGADAKWGTKVYYKTMIDIGLLEKCVAKNKVNGTYCPTTEAFDKYPELFFYDTVRNIWGFSNKNMSEFEDLIVPTMSRRAVIVREQYEEQKRLRAAAARAMSDSGRDTLF